MDLILNFLRDDLSGIPYFLTVLFCIFFIFSIIGYLVGQRYISSK